MPRSFTWLAAIHILLFALTACELSPDVVICNDGKPPVIKTPTTIKEVATTLGAPVQLYTYNPAQENTFNSAQGTAVVIPAHAFVDENGKPVTTPVHVQLREVFDKATMVLTAMPTISDGRALESAGEFYLAPEEKVKWADGISVTLSSQIPPSVTSMEGMQLFAAQPISDFSFDCFHWSPQIDTTFKSFGQTASAKIPSALLNAGYEWINFDRFLPDEPKDTIIVTIPGENIDLKTNTMAYVLFQDNNTAFKFCESAGIGKLKSPGIPLGTAVSTVVIRTLNGKVYYGRTNTIVDGKKYLAPNILEITPEALVDSLKLLK
ncbi:hypothetical protein PK28_07775 [Hymenobacter sp. DG25B]|uniref:hypothetical protein n=1 Tax=Hymenobacter sp. DG25B TaxID=1385664 RepID=UPI000540B571|nr:hypothetical protein [Hymenobacter sp. DG25B]AIZ63615.1 hypothetical protein PK28_07775 [Hymenobacter sp. DG25B]